MKRVLTILAILFTVCVDIKLTLIGLGIIFGTIAITWKLFKILLLLGLIALAVNLILIRRSKKRGC